MSAVWRIVGAPTGPVTTVMWRSSFSSSLLSSTPDCSMARALGPLQPGWGNLNCGWHTVSPYDPMERRRGLMAPSTGKPTGQGKGTGTSPTHGGVARSKAAVAVVVQGRVLGGGGTVLHGDHSDGGVGQQLHEAGQGSHR
jgi:hypothetical protein